MKVYFFVFFNFIYFFIDINIIKNNFRIRSSFSIEVVYDEIIIFLIDLLDI